MKDSQKEIIKKIQAMSGRYSAYDIFSDWVELMAIAIQDNCVLIHDEVWQERERRYAEIMKAYTEKEKDTLIEMFVLLVKEMEDELANKSLTDVLGEIYMGMEAGSKHLGQVFTPYNLALLCNCIAVEDNDEPVRFAEPACGGGSMIIATAQKLLELEKDYQRIMSGICQDLDDKCVHMCYVQLSLLGIDAIVAQGDSLTDPYRKGYPKERVWRTPRNMGLIF